MTKLEKILLITVVTLGMVVLTVICAIVADASDVVKPMKPDVESKPLERIPMPVDIFEDEENVDEQVKIKEEPVEEIETKSIVEPVEKEVVEEVRYFDIPLDEGLQDHIFALCEASGVDVSVVLAMIDRESKFDINAVGDGGRALGLMQIHPRWHGARMNRLECWDLMDPYQNMTVAVDLIAELAASGNSIEWVLMAYNGGEAYADRKVAAGEVSEYAAEVLANAERYLFERSETR